MSKPIESNEQIKVVIGKPKGNVTPLSPITAESSNSSSISI